jgi:signal transduction histidine kinase/CheY-like chemotaxis protein
VTLVSRPWSWSGWRARLGLGLVLGLAAGGLSAADSEIGVPLVRAFKPRDYQGSPAVARVLPHPGTGELLLLAGTQLHIFNGATWTAVQTDTPAARCLAVDAAGRVWLGGVDQLGYASRDANGTWHFQPLADQLPAEQRKLGRIWDCVVLGEAVWFATDTKVLRWQDGTFRVWTFPGTGTLLAAGGRLFFQLKNQALLRWDGTDFRELSRDPLVAGPSIMRLYTAESGTLVGMTSAGSFFRLRGGQVEPLAPEFKATLGKARLICALPRPGGGWYAGTDRAGVLVTDAAGRLVRRLDKAAGLTDSPVMDLALDRDGALWVATLAGPFQVAQPEGASFFGEAQGVPPGFSPSLERHQGRLYLSTPTGLLQLGPGAAGAPAGFQPVPGSPRYTQKMIALPDGLLVTHSQGLTRLHDGQFTALVTTDGSNFLTAIAASADARWLFVGRSAGFTIYERVDRTVREVRHFPALGQVRTVHVDPDGTVWLGTSSRGIHHLQPGPAPALWAEPVVTTFDTAHGTLPGGSDSVFAVPSSEGPLFHTDAGQVRYDPATQHFVPETRFQFNGQPISALGMGVVAGPGEAWGSANFDRVNSRPLYGRFLGTTFEAAPSAVQEALGPIDGGPGLVEGTGADETVWLKTVEGLIRLRPAALVASSAEWATQLTRFEAEGRIQPLVVTKAQFRYSRQPYVFGFQAPHLAPGAQVEYQSRLAGWDSAWSAWSPSPEVRYLALPAGDYRLEVRARDRLGQLATPATFAFAVTPPLWLTGWALAGYVLAGAALLYAYLRWRLGRAERERERLEALVAVRTRDLAIARDAAEASSRAKSAFLASMSHELRTPLNGVLGYAQLLQGDKRLAPDQQERLRIVHQSGEHLLLMINDVLDLAKIEAGKLTLRPAPFALGDLLRDIAAAHLHAAGGKGLAFTVETAPDLPAWVEADAQKLRQILDNLIGNAIKFTARGSVILRVAPAEPGLARLIFSVTDTGPGISAADQARLFQAFEQAGANEATTAGTGLGLAISRALVERFGGTLTLDSAPGRGSTFAFTLLLPAVAPGVAATAAGRRIVGYSGRARRVLIVDDHAINRRLLAELLAPLGFDCADFASPVDTLARLTDGAEPWPEVVIVDLRMPGIDGLEFTPRLRGLPRGAEVKILLTSASVIAFDPASATQAGCDDFLPKPFRTAELLEKLGRLLGLAWRESDTVPPFPGEAAPGSPLPDAARAALRECLATGDLDALAAELARQRAQHPGAAARFDELAAAAAGFQLARLRQLLE